MGGGGEVLESQLQYELWEVSSNEIQGKVGEIFL